jgi:hypothetical protein
VRDSYMALLAERALPRRALAGTNTHAQSQPERTDLRQRRANPHLVTVTTNPGGVVNKSAEKNPTRRPSPSKTTGKPA